MKWNWTLGLMGTSENLTLLNSAPMYSRNKFELEEGVAWVDVSSSKKMRKKGLRVQSLEVGKSSIVITSLRKLS